MTQTYGNDGWIGLSVSAASYDVVGWAVSLAELTNHPVAYRFATSHGKSGLRPNHR